MGSYGTTAAPAEAYGPVTAFVHTAHGLLESDKGEYWDLTTRVSATHNTTASRMGQYPPVGRWPPGCVIMKKKVRYIDTCLFS